MSRTGERALWMCTAVLTLGGAFVFPLDSSAAEDCRKWLEIGNVEAAQADKLRIEAGGQDILGHLEKAEDAYSRARKACPEAAEAGRALAGVESRLGYFYLKAEKWAKACAVYEDLLERDPARLLDRALYADALQEAGRFGEAAAQYEVLVESEAGKEPALYCRVALLYALDLREADSAIEAAEKGLSLGDQPEPCLIYAWGKGLELRAVDKMKQGEIEEALSSYKEAELKYKGLLGNPHFGEKARDALARLSERIADAEPDRKTKESR